LKDFDKILETLSDGKFHSGKALAQELNCSRSSVWKKIKSIKSQYDIEIFAVTGRGYKLQTAIEVLKKRHILEFLSKPSLESLVSCNVVTSTSSTNSLAMNSSPELNKGIAWFAEHQISGKGRRGREWYSPFGQNIYFSLAWNFNIALAEISSLSIAAGATLAALLHENGIREHELKWPNDLIFNNSKLAGILIEAQGETNGPTTVAIGVGLNLDMSFVPKEYINQSFVGLKQMNCEKSRNEIAGRLLNSMIVMCQNFSLHGLAPFIEKWNHFDKLLGKDVQVISPSKTEKGMYLGLTSNGGLKLRVNNREKIFYAGELSLRTLK
tara:strand:- start:553 stop:1527 length:975 start_codon:yes stop_codon:yes gene_type:complete